MVIKIRKKSEKGESYYKSSKGLILPHEAREADKFDYELNKNNKEIEQFIIKNDLLNKRSKKNILKKWYEVGLLIRKFLEKHRLDVNDESLFWKDLYNRFPLLKNQVLKRGISGESRNDFKMAKRLSRFDYKIVKKIGNWSIWREILSYKLLNSDIRIRDWVINELCENPKLREDARLLLRAVTQRFKGVYTEVLNSEELEDRLKQVKDSL